MKLTIIFWPIVLCTVLTTVGSVDSKCSCRLRAPQNGGGGAELVTYNDRRVMLECKDTLLLAKHKTATDDCYFEISAKINSRGLQDPIKFDTVEIKLGKIHPHRLVILESGYADADSVEIEVVPDKPKIALFSDMEHGGPTIKLTSATGHYRLDYKKCNYKIRWNYRELWMDIDHAVYNSLEQDGVCMQCGTTVENSLTYELLNQQAPYTEITKLEEPFRTLAYTQSICAPQGWLGCTVEDRLSIWKNNKCGYVIDGESSPFRKMGCWDTMSSSQIWRRRFYYLKCEEDYCQAKVYFPVDPSKWDLAICRLMNEVAKYCMNGERYFKTKDTWTQTDLSYCPKPTSTGSVPEM